MSAKLLIADDEIGIRTALELLLEEEGYSITTVPDGKKAIELIRGEEFDLVISDVRMPGASGLEILEEIRRMTGGPDLIIMTAYGSIETAIQALKNGARDFLIKPFSNDLLKMTIQRALQIRDISEECKKLRELERMKKEFITMIAHELRTPLTAIKGYLKLVLSGMSGELKSNQKEFLGVVHQNAERLQNIINKMIDMGQLETADFSLQTMAANTLNVIWESISELQHTYEKKQLQLEVNLSASLKPILVDPNRMKQVVNALLDNAVLFSSPNKRIWLSVQKWSGVSAVEADERPSSYVDFSTLEDIDYLEISIKDEGPGIPEDKLSRIFEKFYQIDDLYVRQVGGVGVGLSLCKKLVEIMGGKIWVKSNFGQGCEFTFILPWHVPPDEVKRSEDEEPDDQKENENGICAA